MTGLFDLGPHAGFILASYAAAVLVIGGLIVRAVLDLRSQRTALARLEQRGARRRSERTAASETAA